MEGEKLGWERDWRSDGQSDGERESSLPCFCLLSSLQLSNPSLSFSGSVSCPIPRHDRVALTPRHILTSILTYSLSISSPPLSPIKSTSSTRCSTTGRRSSCGSNIVSPEDVINHVAELDNGRRIRDTDTNLAELRSRVQLN